MTTSIAISQDDKILGEVQVYGRISHSERLMDLLETLLRVQNLKLEDLDLLVAGRGPGSFTGIRIGVTTIRTLAQVLKKRCPGGVFSGSLGQPIPRPGGAYSGCQTGPGLYGSLPG